MKKISWKKILVAVVWTLAGAGTIVLFGAAMKKKNQLLCDDIKIEIKGDAKNLFIDEQEVLALINSTGPVKNSIISELNLRQMESLVEKNLWVSNAEMFFDNNRVLQVIIEERQPVARVFSLDGGSFYLDSAALRLPLSEKLSAKVPVFTGFPSDKSVLSKPDSALLFDVVKIGKYILADSFWMAQISQVNIDQQGNFEMVPLIGDHMVLFGGVENMDRKFDRLYTFYQKAWLQNGINKYEVVDVQYENQIVAVNKGARKAWADSAKALAMIRGMMDRTAAALADSTNKTIIPMKDSVKVHPTITVPATTVDKQKTKTNTTASGNNKTNAKPLSDEKKSGNNKVTKKEPKAVMEKTQE